MGTIIVAAVCLACIPLVWVFADYKEERDLR